MNTMPTGNPSMSPAGTVMPGLRVARHERSECRDRRMQGFPR
jgi:hypothetical protein